MYFFLAWVFKNYLFQKSFLYDFPFFLSVSTFDRGRTSSVSRALDCRAGGCGFDSRGRTNNQGLQTTEKHCTKQILLQMAGPSWRELPCEKGKGACHPGV